MSYEFFLPLMKYGVSGVGCGLSILAFQLLQKEQSRKTIRKGMMRSIYVFMSLSLGFATASLIMQTASQRSASGTASQDQLDASKIEAGKSRAKLATVRTTLTEFLGKDMRSLSPTEKDDQMRKTLMNINRELIDPNPLTATVAVA